MRQIGFNGRWRTSGSPQLRRGDRQNPADRLDPIRRAVIIDEGDHGLNVELQCRASLGQNKRSLCAGSHWSAEARGSPAPRHSAVRRPRSECQRAQLLRRTAYLVRGRGNCRPPRGMLAFVIRHHAAPPRNSPNCRRISERPSKLGVRTSPANRSMGRRILDDNCFCRSTDNHSRHSQDRYASDNDRGCSNRANHRRDSSEL